MRLESKHIDGSPYGLTDSEIDVIRALCAGRDSAGAAAVMSKSIYTVRDHLKDIYRKMSVCHRAPMAVLAERAGLLEGIEP